MLTMLLWAGAIGVAFLMWVDVRVRHAVIGLVLMFLVLANWYLFLRGLAAVLFGWE